jgi:hypothetical protein
MKSASLAGGSILRKIQNMKYGVAPCLFVVSAVLLLGPTVALSQKDASVSTLLCHLVNMAQDAGETPQI